MKHIYKQGMMLICISISITAHTQQFDLIDVNKATDGFPANNFEYDAERWEFCAKYGYAVLNGIAYFGANDGVNGDELWRSDGTPEGTYRVINIHPDNPDEEIYNITVSGSKLFFKVAADYNDELWVSDGTAAGTTMLLSSYSGLLYLTDVHGTLYFMRSMYGFADELWKSDGTVEGTQLLDDLYWEAYGYRASKLTTANGKLFFVLESYYDGPELYTSDGTVGNAHLVKDINPGWGSYPSQLTGVGKYLYFSADDGTGRQVWVTDGTNDGTYKLNNPDNIFVNDFGGVNFTVMSYNVYFSGNVNDGDGSRLCSFNTANISAGVSVVKNINPGTASGNLYNITNVTGKIFFTVFNGMDQVLWKSDGTAAGTVQVKDINPGGRNIYWYKEFENAKGTLLFSFYDDENGSELWKSDGTEAGTVMVKDINPGVYSAQPSNLTYIGKGITLFLATNGRKGMELWKTDGTEAGTMLLADINKTRSWSSDPAQLMANPDNSKLLFVANEWYRYGTELRITNGTAEGTKVVKDLFKGVFNSNPGPLINFKNDTYFFADILDTTNHTTSDVRTIRKLCKTDGTAPGTKILSVPALESVLNGSGYVYAMEASSNLLYILLYNYNTYQYELWRTNGTAAGTYAIKSDMPAYYNVTLKAVGDKLFFNNYDFTYGNELYVTKGTVASTKMVKDISQGYGSTYLYSFTFYNGKLYFGADYGYGPFLWSSDGTDGGTYQIKPGYSSYNSYVQACDKLFVPCIKTVGQGVELYAVNKHEKVNLLKDIYAGPGSSYPAYLTGGDTLLYFFANDGIHGQELWKSNGTKEGTRLVKDITPDWDTYPSELATVHNQLFFTLNDILWQSDGTNLGTHKVNDAVLKKVSDKYDLKAFGNKLAFVGYAVKTGRELYVADLGTPALTAGNTNNALVSKDMVFNVKVYPNPTPLAAIAEIPGNAKNVTVSIKDISGRMVWLKTNIGASRISLPTENLPAGVYLVTITNGTESSTQKLVKE